MEVKKRNPIIAAMLSVISPGLGQVYNGQLKKGIIFYLASFLMIFFLAMTGLQYQFYGVIALALIVICWHLFIIGDALFIAIKTKEITLKPYNKWYLYLFFAILTISISAITNDFIKNEVIGVKAYKMPAGSMAPTLLIGDHLIVDLKYYKTKKPGKGDIIVFKYPEDPGRDFIKRVIAIEGDVIESKNKVVYVNGKAVIEPYVQHTDSYIRPKGNEPGDNFGPLTVPKNKVFVMGDNRDQSYDSRYWGFVGIEAIRGKALYIYWSKNKGRLGKEIK